MIKSFPKHTGMLLCLILISGLGLGDAIFFSKPLQILDIEIPKSLIYIFLCHLTLTGIFSISKISVGRFTLTIIMLSSLMMYLLTNFTPVSKLYPEAELFSFLLLYIRWAILQLYIPKMVPTKVRGTVFCLGFAASMIGENLELVNRSSSHTFPSYLTYPVMYMIACLGIWRLPPTNGNVLPE